jgi:signal transduction histidine kinase
LATNGTPMTAPPSQRQPTFLWQGLLILLPVVVLVATGLWTMRQDRAVMERDIRLRAEPVASATLAELQRRLHPVRFGEQAITLPGKLAHFEVQPDGSLNQPWLYTWPPTPCPFPTNLLARIEPDRAQNWIVAQTAVLAGQWEEACEHFTAFATAGSILKRNDPGPYDGLSSERLRGEANFQIAHIHERLGRTNLAIEAYDRVLASFYNGSDTRSESGLALPHLAALRVLDLAQDHEARLPQRWQTNLSAVLWLLQGDGSPFGDLLANRLLVLDSPTEKDLILPSHLQSAPQVIKEAQRQYLKISHHMGTRAIIENWWWEQEAWRLYYEAAHQSQQWPAQFWVDGRYRWLAVLQQPDSVAPRTSRSGRFCAFAESRVAEELKQSVRIADPLGEFAVRAEIGGSTIRAGEGNFTDWQRREIFATARSAENGWLVTVTLVDPVAFFSAQRQRQLLFCGLLLVSAVACVLAFASAWRAFRRQLRLNAMKSNFVSSVSHELRAPIASVRLLAESLERGKISEPAKQNEYFRFIGQECRRLSALIENVLDFSRIEQGRKQYEFEPTDMSALVEQTVKLMQPYAEERGVRLETSNTQRPTPNVELNVDGRAIQQALVNLIDNAIKHSPKGEAVTVKLETDGETSNVQRPTSNVELTNKRRGASLNPQPSTLNLSVSDSGPGIPASEHEKIFERFYRLGSELRRETQGVGIGLSIVKHVVEAHGGRVRVESEVGKGSRFTIGLPVTQQEQTEKTEEQQK